MRIKNIVAIGGGMYLLLIFTVLSIGGIIGAICWPYAINSWLVYAGKEAQILWWQGFLLGYVPAIGQLALPCAIATWLLMLFLV